MLHRRGWALPAVAMAALVAVSACGPMVHIAAEPVGDGGPAPTDAVSIQVRVSVDALEVAISNLGSSPVDVLWDKSSLVDTDGEPSSLVHSDPGGWARAGPLGNGSRILGHATLDTFIVPMRRLSFTKESGWVVAPLLPVECGPLRCVGYHELVGKTLQLTLVTQIEGAEQAFDWTLRITQAVRSIRGGRPKDPNLH